MIADVLSRDFIIEQIRSLQTQLAKDSVGREGGGPGAEDVGGSDYVRASEAIDQTIAKEEAAPPVATSRSGGSNGFMAKKRSALNTT
jgi:hypothetical protein